jgi:CRP-like cAMP-binding protein
MALDNLVQSLRHVALFAGLRPLQITELARRSDRIVYKPGDLIITEGEDADAAILIVKGDVARVAGPGLSTAAEPVPVGSLLAEMAMLVPTQHTSTVVACSPVRAIRLTRSAVIAQIELDQALAEQLVKTLAGRLNAVAQQLHDIDDSLAQLDLPYHPTITPTVRAPQQASMQLH